MRLKTILAILAVLTMAIAFVVPTGIMAQKSRVPLGQLQNYVPDKILCAKMLRLGQEYYSRGKYLDAKNFFRRAIEADMTSKKAWRYYDQAIVFALAEKVEKQNDLLVPDVSIRSEGSSHQGASAALPTTPVVKTKPAAAPADKEAEVEEEEGC